MLCKGVREPLTHACTDLKFSKDRDLCPEPCDNGVIQLQRCHSEQSYLQDTSGNANPPFPIPSLVPNTKGVNEPISTSSTCCCYFVSSPLAP